MSYETLEIETQRHARIIRINRPKALNALNPQVVSELGRAFDAIDAQLRAWTETIR